MTLAQSRGALVDRVAEVRVVQAHISSLEASLGTAPASQELLCLRGLFFVLLYGVFEFAVNSGIQEFLRALRSLGVRFVHLAPGAYTYALDRQFDSISGSNGKKVFLRRIDLIGRQASADVVDMPDTLFGSSLQGIHAADFESIFTWLDLKAVAFPPTLVSQRGYLDEIVEKRHKVAHGREGAANVGQGTRSADLVTRMNAVSACIEHLYSTLEVHLASRDFVGPSHKAAYP